MSRFLALTFIGFIVLSSCVSSKKFSDMEVLKEYYKYKNDTLLMVQKENKTLQSELRSVKIELGQTKDQYDETKNSLQNTVSQLETLKKQYAELESNNQELASNALSESSQLKQELSATQAERDKIKGILNNLDRAYQIHLNGAIMANETWEQQMTRMQDVSQTIDAERSQLSNLQELLGSLPLFAEAGFELFNGRKGLTVRLESDQIFRSGKTQLNTKGRNIIKEITGVILRNSNLNVHIEGHTDDSGTDSTNWTLSSSRATAVAKAMIEADFMPTRLFATGRSSHEPVNFDTTPEAKKANRRIEIIVKPRTMR